MADLYLERIGIARPTIVERDNKGEIERLESVGLDIASLVAFWRRCFDLNGHLFEKIILHCKSKDFNAMGERTLAACRNVREIFAEQGVECVIDDEWFKGKEENDCKQKIIAISEAEKQGGKNLRDAIINAMSNRNYMGVSYKWASFSDNDIDSIFNEVFNNDKK